MINVKRMRKVANRIDPATREKGIAGYNQGKFGSFYEGKKEKYEDVRIRNIPECDTACCIAGHAFILAYGRKKYLKYATDREPIGPMSGMAQEALGLTDAQADVLFRGVLSTRELEDTFDIRIVPSGRDEAGSVAAMIRQIANRYKNDK